MRQRPTFKNIEVGIVVRSKAPVTLPRPPFLERVALCGDTVCCTGLCPGCTDAPYALRARNLKITVQSGKVDPPFGYICIPPVETPPSHYMP